MPLCKTKMDETTVEDLAELSEIENHNLGQVCAPSVTDSGTIFLSGGIFHCYEQCKAPFVINGRASVYFSDSYW